MATFKRKITYFYEHHKDLVGTTAGFMKLEIRGDKVKIIINIQEPAGLPYQEANLYFYHEAQDQLIAVKVGTVQRINGMLTYQDRTKWQQMYGTGRDLYTFDGVAVVYNEHHYYIGDFEDKNRKDFTLVLKPQTVEGEKAPVANAYRPGGRRASDNIEAVDTAFFRKNPEQISETGTIPTEDREKQSGIEEKAMLKETAKPAYRNAHMEEAGKIQDERVGNSEDSGQKNTSVKESAVYGKCEDCPYHKKRMEHKQTQGIFEKMLAEYPKLPMYGATELFDCVRIHPRDIGKLDMRNWKLGVNSFLTHGFYTYQYLLLGRMRFQNGQERPILGVPGVFSNRDRYLANMFGFDQFIPVKKTGTKTGEFGYWIVELQ